MKLVSVNVSLPKRVEYEGRHVTTGIYKEPVAGRVRVGAHNVEGDGQADLSVHGGSHKAVHAYDLESYEYWQEELGRDDLGHGHFGENFTVRGMTDDSVYIGDTFRIGTALFEVSGPRTPCYKLEMKMGLPGFSRKFVRSGRSGFYFRVLEEGEVGAGDPVERVKVGPEQVSVREFVHTFYFDKDNREKIQQILRIPSIPPGWRRTFEKISHS
jgi:MOSC domain-containing protein YiiM